MARACVVALSARFRRRRRSTDYGDRFRLYRVATPDMNIPEPEYRYGIKLEPAEDDRYEIINMDAKGLAGQAGLQIGDYVTEVDE